MTESQPITSRGSRQPSVGTAPVATIQQGAPASRRQPPRRMNPPPAPEAEPEGNRWSARGALLLGLVGLVLLIGGFGLWSGTSRIAGAVVAPGQVEVE